MMKVLSPSVESGSWKYETVCDGRGNGNHGCGSKLEVSNLDLFHTANYDYGGGSDHYVTFECVVCRTWNDVGSNQMPYGLRSTILSKSVRSPSRQGSDNSEK
jgi:hypothetical protein